MTGCATRSFEKAMSRVAIDRVYNDLSALGHELGPDRIGLDVNIVIAGPGTSPETAVEDAVRTAHYALEAGVRHKIKVDLNLHPYYQGRRGRPVFRTIGVVHWRRRYERSPKSSPWFDRWRQTPQSSLAGKTRGTTKSVGSAKAISSAAALPLTDSIRLTILIRTQRTLMSALVIETVAAPARSGNVAS